MQTICDLPRVIPMEFAGSRFFIVDLGALCAMMTSQTKRLRPSVLISAHTEGRRFPPVEVLAKSGWIV